MTTDALLSLGVPVLPAASSPTFTQTPAPGSVLRLGGEDPASRAAWVDGRRGAVGSLFLC